MSLSDHIPPGTMMMWSGGAGQYTAPVGTAGSIAAPGWLYCDGSAVSSSTYPTLQAAIGARYNTGGEVAGTFRLPGVSGYMAKATTAATNAEHVSSSTSHTHTISVPSLTATSSAASDHSSTHADGTISTTDGTGDHTHSVAGTWGAGATAGRADGNYIGIASHTHDGNSPAATINASTGANHSITVNAVADSATHTHNTHTVTTTPVTNSSNQTIVQPTMDLWHIIKI